MNFTDLKAPATGTVSLIFVTALIGAVVGTLVTKWGGAVLSFFTIPFKWCWLAIYRVLAARIPTLSLRRYKQHLMRSPLAFIEAPVGPAVRVPLDHAYAPLRLLDGEDSSDIFTSLQEQGSLVIVGGPGTGKTTLMKSLVSAAVLGRNAIVRNRIPVFIELRSLGSNHRTLEAAINASFCEHGFEASSNYVKAAISEGRLLIVLDGLDEVSVNWAFVIEQIVNFCTTDSGRNRRNQILVTCREQSYKRRELRDVIPTVLRVEPFSNRHIRTFLQGWPSHKNRNALSLYQEIRKDGEIRDICRNPLMLTLLTGVFLDNDVFDMPQTRNEFYDAAISELIVNRSARRALVSAFREHQKRAVLQQLALQRLESTVETEDPELFDRRLILAVVKAVMGTDEPTDELLTELVERDGILRSTGDRGYTFAHRTIQEYLAAVEAGRSKTLDQVLQRFADRADLIQVLYFYCGRLKNVPQIEQVLYCLLRSHRLLEAGRCLLYVTERLPVDCVKNVVLAIGRSLHNSGIDSELLDVLASLAQRPNPEFRIARTVFDESVDALLSDSGAGAQSLGMVLKTLDEAALQILPGFLTSSDAARRTAAVAFLRDVDLPETLDQLVELLDSPDPSMRAEAATTIFDGSVELLEEVGKRGKLLRTQKNGRDWPFGDVFDRDVALALIEAMPPTASCREPVFCAAINSRHSPKGQRLWSLLPLHRRLNRCRMRIAITMHAIVAVATWGMILAAPALSLYYLIEPKGNIVFLSQCAPYFGRVPREPESPFLPLENLIDTVAHEVWRRYPATDQGWARILPSNWSLAPSLPKEYRRSWEVISQRDWSALADIESESHRLVRLLHMPYALSVAIAETAIPLRKLSAAPDRCHAMYVRPKAHSMAERLYFTTLLILTTGMIAILRHRRSRVMPILPMTVSLSILYFDNFFFITSSTTILILAFVLSTSVENFRWPRNELLRHYPFVKPNRLR